MSSKVYSDNFVPNFSFVRTYHLNVSLSINLNQSQSIQKTEPLLNFSMKFCIKEDEGKVFETIVPKLFKTFLFLINIG